MVFLFIEYFCVYRTVSNLELMANRFEKTIALSFCFLCAPWPQFPFERHIFVQEQHDPCQRLWKGTNQWQETAEVLVWEASSTDCFVHLSVCMSLYNLSAHRSLEYLLLICSEYSLEDLCCIRKKRRWLFFFLHHGKKK